MKLSLKSFKQRVWRAANKLHHAHPAVHAVYFGLVAVEAGKWYSMVAGGLLVMSLVEFWTERGED